MENIKNIFHSSVFKQSGRELNGSVRSFMKMDMLPLNDKKTTNNLTLKYYLLATTEDDELISSNLSHMDR